MHTETLIHAYPLTQDMFRYNTCTHTTAKFEVNYGTPMVPLDKV